MGIMIKSAKSKLILWLLFATTCLNAFTLANYYTLPHKNPQAQAILKDYEKFMNRVKYAPLKKKLIYTNQYLNTLNGKFDSDKDPNVDYWSTRGEFLLRGGGDCEDYVIAKYYTLKDLGIDENKMALLVVKERYSKQYHMVLGVWQNKNNPLILDNLSFRILPLRKRVDLVPIECMNKNGYFKVDKYGNKIQKQTKYKAYEDMLKRLKKEKIWK